MSWELRIQHSGKRQVLCEHKHMFVELCWLSLAMHVISLLFTAKFITWAESLLRYCVELQFVIWLQARMQEMKEKELKYLGNGDANSHVCKVCFESPTAAILLPCRHFCCKFSLNISETLSLRFMAIIIWVFKLCKNTYSLLFALAVCKSCSLACSECPICRTNITDRLLAFTS